MTMTQTRLLIGSGALVALLVAFAFGRWSAPAATVTERVELKDKIVFKDRIVERVVTRTVEVAGRRVVVNREVIVYRDGTSKTTEQEVTQATSTATSDVVADKDASKAAEVELSATSARTVEQSRPDWKAGLLGGLDVPRRKAIAGAQVERRIIGPVAAGLWFLSNGSGGISVSATF